MLVNALKYNNCKYNFKFTLIGFCIALLHAFCAPHGAMQKLENKKKYL